MANDHTILDVLVLCGGRGTRIQSVLPDRPKVLAPIGNRTYLDYLLQSLTGAGFRRIVLAIGHMGEQVEAHIRSSGWGEREGVEIVLSREDEPLGTGGAVKNAERHIKSDPFIVLNGDTLFKLDFRKLHSFHTEKNGKLTIALAKQEGKDFARVVVDEQGRILEYREKELVAQDGYVSAGIYMISRELFGIMEEGVFSFEYDFVPKVSDGLYGFTEGVEFLDIGTPERYEKIKEVNLYSDDEE